MQILKVWDKVSKLPAGKFLFKKFLSRMVPYTGSISPTVLELSAGHARVQIEDKKAHRNHLSSIHAVAMMNLAEAASGLAFTTALPANARAILTGFQIEFVKKARGTLTAEAKQEAITLTESKDFKVAVEVKDSSGDVVCRAQALWKAGLKK